LERLVYRRLVLYECDLSAPLPVPTGDIDATVRRLELDDLHAYLAFDPRARESVFRSRLAEGQRCYATCVDGGIVSCVWVAIGRAAFPGIEAVWKLGPADVYSHDLYTLPEFRGRNLATVQAARKLAQLRDEGFRRAVCFVWPENKRGHGPTTKSGYRRSGSIGWIGLYRRGLYWLRLDGRPTVWAWRFRRGRGPIEF
jgi:GNAT superfamily N-acetyltransferase